TTSRSVVSSQWNASGSSTISGSSMATPSFVASAALYFKNPSPLAPYRARLLSRSRSRSNQGRDLRLFIGRRHRMVKGGQQGVGGRRPGDRLEFPPNLRLPARQPGRVVDHLSDGAI